MSCTDLKYAELMRKVILKTSEEISGVMMDLTNLFGPLNMTVDYRYDPKTNTYWSTLIIKPKKEKMIAYAEEETQEGD